MTGLAGRGRLRIPWAAVLLLTGAVTAQAEGLAVVGATVVGGTALLRDAVIVTEGERIMALGPRAIVPIPKGVRIVDGRGRWIAPARGAVPLAPGGPADFLILDRDLAVDPGALEAPYRLVKQGRLVVPDTSRRQGER